ncbi:3-isopropylmalate dehydratase large subunit [Microvirga sp. BT689]|uniref:3-isopropylmalate dehydratase large subunit n=1 Tax=Microvirga arvi TaxID=2778731 RepID=UPI00194F6059|nr:3-isopropylmalate dehydratase large subunit [Microvirga arvi]MBM6583238.1 3-isopropylmalate dehydratase large subunit [Microvirga arvi]
MSQTLFEKVWSSHEILRTEDGDSLLYVDRHLVHEGSRTAIDKLDDNQLGVARRHQTFGTADHYVPTQGGLDSLAVDQRKMVETFDANMSRFGIEAWGLGTRRQGIVHVIGPELGLTLPGMVLVCGDSHTSTHGALGALAFGIGASEVAHVLATQAIWQRTPKAMRVSVNGRLAPGVFAKDVILAIIAKIGTGGATGHVIEYAGPVIEAMSIEERLTVCNMSIEAGARAGLVAPDETTFAYVRDRPFAPTGEMLEQAIAYWRSLRTDTDARFDAEITIDQELHAPMITWGTTPETAIPVDGTIPDPESAGSPERRDEWQRALDYMGLAAGERLQDVQIDQVFIGSCTNGRIEDLRAAAEVAKKGRARVPVLVSPGSMSVRAQAEAEGLDRIFTEAGFEWRGAGCSMCVGMNGDLVGFQKRSVSTSNRNFVGRQGVGARTHLASPASAAASALCGHIADVRSLF